MPNGQHDYTEVVTMWRGDICDNICEIVKKAESGQAEICETREMKLWRTDER